jgi:PadR family transcriptional regulator, regulatory protein PadR
MYHAHVTEQTLFILASLTSGELHGYGIARDVDELSEGRVRLTAGTLYGALNRLTAEGLVAQTREQVVGGRRRRYYRLTGEGAAVLDAEVARLHSMAASLRARTSVGAKPRPGLA